MACAAIVQIGPARQSFWALYLRGEDELRERTRLLPRRSALRLDEGARERRRRARRARAPGACASATRASQLDLELAEEAGFARSLRRTARQQVWTRKQAGIAARGTLALDGGAPQSVRARAVIDDTAGYHARDTEWRWSAGVGESADGRALAWNLVSGVNDPPSGSERAVWVDGEPHEAPRGRTFAEDLRRDRRARTARRCAFTPRPSAAARRTC